MAHDVFISYSSHDKPTADAICASLESRGVRCWIAPRDVLPGVYWPEAIINALEQAQLMVLIFSSHANASRQVMREVERAASRDMPILPLRIENVLPAKSMELFLGTPHWLDALTPPLQDHLDRLGRNVEALLNPDPPAERVVRAPVLSNVPSSTAPPASPSVSPGWRTAAVGAAMLALLAVIVFLIRFSARDDTGEASEHPSATETAMALQAAATTTQTVRDYLAVVSTQEAERLAATAVAPTQVSSAPAQAPPAPPSAPQSAPPQIQPASTPTPVPPAVAGSCASADFDRDGLCDSLDLCRNTNSAWFPVDANGCAQREVDFDLDLVCDPGAESSGPQNCQGLDLCDNTNSAWFPVDASGCAQREVDFDLDGVCDPGAESPGPANCTGTDLCTGTLPGRPVNEVGCG